MDLFIYPKVVEFGVFTRRVMVGVSVLISGCAAEKVSSAVTWESIIGGAEQHFVNVPSKVKLAPSQCFHLFLFSFFLFFLGGSVSNKDRLVTPHGHWTGFCGCRLQSAPEIGHV